MGKKEQADKVQDGDQMLAIDRDKNGHQRTSAFSACCVRSLRQLTRCHGDAEHLAEPYYLLRPH